MRKFLPLFYYILPALLIIGGILLWEHSSTSQRPAPSTGFVEALTSDHPSPLSVPDGFDISIFAQNLPGVREMVRDAAGNVWVSQTHEGAVSFLTVENGAVVNTEEIFSGLSNPHGLAFDPEDSSILYIAQDNKISRVRTDTHEVLDSIMELPGGGQHVTRTIAFGPDDRLYVSVGSSCDVCIEDSELRASIHSMDKAGQDLQRIAEGLRNSVFFAWHPITQALWATDMGRDFLGDNLPPDEVNHIIPDKHYGWPFCYGDQIRDIAFRPDIVFNCSSTEPAVVSIQAHAAPLGIDFVPSDGWPEAWQYDALVALHGSWNRAEPAGYKVIRLKFDADGTFTGYEDMITGWISEAGNVYGRPVAIHLEPGGVGFITDDRAGVIYKITYQP